MYDAIVHTRFQHVSMVTCAYKQRIERKRINMFGTCEWQNCKTIGTLQFSGASCTDREVREWVVNAYYYRNGDGGGVPLCSCIGVGCAARLIIMEPNHVRNTLCACVSKRAECVRIEFMAAVYTVTPPPPAAAQVG